MRFTPYSFSKLSSHQQCPRKFKYYYVDKVPHPKLPQIHFDKGKFIHMLFEFDGDLKTIQKQQEYKDIISHGLLSKENIKEYFMIYKKFRESSSIFGRKVLFKELSIGVTNNFDKTGYSSKDAMFRGYIDAVFLDEKTNTPIIIDWKTGKDKTKAQQSWQQLLFYGTALFKLMPYDKIVLMYAYVEHDHVLTKVLHREDLPKYEKALMDTIFTVESDFEFPKIESPLCNYCDFQSHCQTDNSVYLPDEEIPF